MLNYNEIKKLAESKRLLISEIADTVGMTSTGFKRSIETGSFPISKVEVLCEMLRIQITEFFGVTSSSSVNNSGNIITRSTAGGDITAGSNAGEVMFLRQQLKEKDHQIQELLNILKK